MPKHTSLFRDPRVTVALIYLLIAVISMVDHHAWPQAQPYVVISTGRTLRTPPEMPFLGLTKFVESCLRRLGGRVGSAGRLPGCTNAPPLANVTLLAEEIRLNIEPVKAMQILRRVAAMQGEAAHGVA